MRHWWLADLELWNGNCVDFHAPSPHRSKVPKCVIESLSMCNYHCTCAYELMSHAILRRPFNTPSSRSGRFGTLEWRLCQWPCMRPPCSKVPKCIIDLDVVVIELLFESLTRLYILLWEFQVPVDWWIQVPTHHFIQHLISFHFNRVLFQEPCSCLSTLFFE